MIVTTRLDVPQPFHADALLDFLAAHVVPGVESVTGTVHARSLDLPGGPGVLELDIGPQQVAMTLDVARAEDEVPALAAVRHLLDLDVDPRAVDAHLGADHVLGPLVEASPGVRVPGSVDGYETAVRTVVGQQVSVAGAQTVIGRIVAEHGAPVHGDLARRHGLTHLFPRAQVLAAADPSVFSMPTSRALTVVTLARAVADGAVDLTGATEPEETRRALLALRGIGPWTADYAAMRALKDPDVLLESDLVLRRELERRGVDRTVTTRWSPWRSYAGMHLWRSAAPVLTLRDEPLDT